MLKMPCAFGSVKLQHVAITGTLKVVAVVAVRLGRFAAGIVTRPEAESTANIDEVMEYVGAGEVYPAGNVAVAVGA